LPDDFASIIYIGHHASPKSPLGDLYSASGSGKNSPGFCDFLSLIILNLQTPKRNLGVNLGCLLSGKSEKPAQWVLPAGAAKYTENWRNH
jgi:hypothetical protein